MKKPKVKILFTESALPFVLKALGNSIDDDGFVINFGGDYVLDIDGKKFKAKKLYGIIGRNYITNFCQLLNLPKLTNTNPNPEQKQL